LQESENYCAKGMTMTYNSSLDHGRIQTDSGYSYGGYSGSITVNRRFLVKVHHAEGLSHGPDIYKDTKL
jgi:hypothetical protein